MLRVAAGVQKDFEQYLDSHDIPADEQKSFQKWLRFYLDFCSKYAHAVESSPSLDAFLGKLSEKNQHDRQKSQAKRAIQFDQRSLIKKTSANHHPGFIPRTASTSPGRVKKPKTASAVQKRDQRKSPDHNKTAIQTSVHGCSWVNEYRRLEEAISIRHYSPKTLRSYRGYIQKFQAYTESLDPMHLSAEHVRKFLTSLAVEKKVSASTQNLAFNSLLFFFRHVLKKDFGPIEGVVRAKKRPYIPVVPSREEINKIIEALDPPYRLIVKLLYGCGLRLFECLNLRVQCLNFDAEILTIHDGKGQKDRTVPIPRVLQKELKDHLLTLKKRHAEDLDKGYGGVFMVNWSLEFQRQRSEHRGG